MGRTLHYRTKEAVSAEEFGQIQEIVKRYNAGHEWACENIKLWKEASGVIWGFTKVGDNDRDRKLVIQAIKEISKKMPRLTWMFYDEGGLEKGKWVRFKGGK